MVDLAKIRAIDIHTHAEEPCGNHADDGYLVLALKPLGGQLGEATEYEVAWSNA